MQKQIQYADADGLQIAYQVWGDGDEVLICVPGLISNIELNQDNPDYVDWMNRLSRNMRVISFDKRGQGLSDRVPEVPGPEQRMDDITAIAKAENLKNFSLLGFSEGAATSLLYAATFPDRTRNVCVFGGFARFSNCDDYDLMFSEARLRKSIKYWGTGASGFSFCPDLMPEARDAVARYERGCCTPNGYQAMLETNFQIDVRSILSEVKVPTLVMHRRDDKAVPVGNGRYLADNLPKANYLEFATGGHLCWLGDSTTVATEIETFLLQTGGQTVAPETVLATVLFTDIVNSSQMLSNVGDEKWRRTLDLHDQRAGAEIEQRNGVFVKSTGDGVLATFDGPVRAIRCAIEFQKSAAELGIGIRAGLHIGEVCPRGEDIAGMAVHVAARVVDKAAANEVLITRTLNDLIVGSGLISKLSGQHDLKGLPGQWPLYSIA